MKSNLLIRLTVLALIMANLAACSKSGSLRDKIIGSWEAKAGLLPMSEIFSADGNVTVILAGESVPGKWSIENDQIIMSLQTRKSVSFKIIKIDDSTFIQEMSNHKGGETKTLVFKRVN